MPLSRLTVPLLMYREFAFTVASLLMLSVPVPDVPTKRVLSRFHVDPLPWMVAVPMDPVSLPMYV